MGRAFPRLAMAVWLTLLWAGGSSLHAQSSTWVGNGADGKWSTGANWASGVAPTEVGNSPLLDQILIFTGSNQLNPVQDIAGGSGGFNVNNIIFASGAGAFTLTDSTGTGIDMLGIRNTTLPSSIGNNSVTTQTINLKLISRAGFTSAINLAAASGNMVISGAITSADTAVQAGAGGILKTGNFTVTLTGTNTYTGNTTVNAGTLLGAQNSGNPFSTGNVVLNGGVLALAPTGTGAISLNGASASASTSFSYAGGATLQLTQGAASSLTYTVGNASASNPFVRAGRGTLVLNVDALASLGSTENFVVRTFTANSANTNGIFDASMVAQQGTGNSGVGTFVKYDSILGFVDAAFGSNAYTAHATDFTTATNEIADVTGTATITDGGAGNQAFAMRVGAVTATLNGTVTIANNGFSAGLILNPTATKSLVTGGTLLFGTSEALVYVGSGSGTAEIASTINGTAGLTKFGPGLLVLSADNSATLTGGISINQGILKVSADNNLGSTSGNNLIFNGGTLQFGAAFSPNVGRTVTLNGGGGTFDTNGFGTTATPIVVASVISGSGPLIKTGAGVLNITGANTYTGGTVINGGTLIINTTDGTTVGAAGALGALPNANSSATPNLIINGGTLLEATVAITLSANRSIGIGPGGATFAANVAGNFTVNSVMADQGGAGALTITGTGNYVPGAQNTYSGGTILTSSTVIPTVSSTGPAGSPTSGPFGTGVLTLGGASMRATTSADITIGNTLNISATTTFVTGATKNLFFTGPATLVGGSRTLTASNATNTVGVFFNGAIGEATAGSGITKNGAGVIVFGGANTYTGATSVTAGTLLVNNTTGSGTGGGNVSVSSGATLGGTGTISGTVAMAGNVSPGGTPSATAGFGIGVLTTGSATFAATSTANAFQLAANGYTGSALNPDGSVNTTFIQNTANRAVGSNDRLQVNGNLDLGTNNGVVVNVTLQGTYVPSYGDAWDLFDWTTLSALTNFNFGATGRTGGESAGTYDLALPSLTNGWTYNLDYFASNGVVIVVPEPGRALLVMGGLGALMLQRRRSR